ncbi:MAG: hypothetical protein ABI068_01895 [Ktedonobacterales bacterium]
MARTPRWKQLNDYSPFARILVEYMWEQRPPLLPAGFAERMGISKQTVSKWLNTPGAPEADLVIQVARRMPMSVHTLFDAAGFTPPEYPLYSIPEAWEFILNRVQESAQLSAEEREHILQALGVIREHDEPTQAAMQPPANTAARRVRRRRTKREMAGDVEMGAADDAMGDEDEDEDEDDDGDQVEEVEEDETVDDPGEAGEDTNEE